MVGNPPRSKLVTVFNPLFDNPGAGAATADRPLAVNSLDQIFDVPMIQTYGLGVQRELTPGTALSVSWEKAARWLRSVLVQAPDNRSALQLLPVSLLELERFEEAARAYEKLLPSDDVSILVGAATAYLKTGRREKGEALLARALSERGGSAEVHFMVGQAQLAVHEYAAAEQSFQHAGAGAGATRGTLLSGRRIPEARERGCSPSGVEESCRCSARFWPRRRCRQTNGLQYQRE